MTGGAQSTKNKLEREAGVTVDSAGLSGADLEQRRLLKAANTTAGPDKDGARLTQLAGDTAHEVEAPD